MNWLITHVNTSLTCSKQEMLVSELGKNWANRFSSFEMKPFAAASIGQVHQAVLLNGQTVALKIQVRLSIYEVKF